MKQTAFLKNNQRWLRQSAKSARLVSMDRQVLAACQPGQDLTVSVPTPLRSDSVVYRFGGLPWFARSVC